MKTELKQIEETINGWKKIKWDGCENDNRHCWRKEFGRGHVSIGCGSFLTVVFSYGANSGMSFSSTRWDYDRPTISERDMMDIIDKNKGKSTGASGTWTTPNHAPEHMRQAAMLAAGYTTEQVREGLKGVKVYQVGLPLGAVSLIQKPNL